MLIVLGDEYKFLEDEVKQINQKFGSISYIDDIQEIGNLSKNDLLLINSLEDIDMDISNQITLEEFCEKYLFKVYVSNDFEQKQIIDIKPFTAFQKFQKFCIDIFGLFWLIFFSWPMMIKSIFKIKQQSPNGNIMFRQNRITKDSKAFTCFKFRTMNNIDNSLNDTQKEKLKYTQDNDSRIFPYGHIMRKFRLDELPQMINMMMFQMHIIAPRSEWDKLVDNYKTIIPNYDLRHTIKSGITGWAQVNYPYGRNSEDARQKLMYDLYYIKHWSIWFELEIVYKTALTVINKKGI